MSASSVIANCNELFEKAKEIARSLTHKDLDLPENSMFEYLDRLTARINQIAELVKTGRRRNAWRALEELERIYDEVITIFPKNANPQKPAADLAVYILTLIAERLPDFDNLIDIALNQFRQYYMREVVPEVATDLRNVQEYLADLAGEIGDITNTMRDDLETLDELDPAVDYADWILELLSYVEEIRRWFAIALDTARERALSGLEKTQAAVCTG